MSQTERLYNLLSDGLPHRTDEILREVYGNNTLALARVGARIYDIKQKYGVKITGWKDSHNPALYWYQIEKHSEIVDRINEESKRMKENKTSEPIAQNMSLFA